MQRFGEPKDLDVVEIFHLFEEGLSVGFNLLDSNLHCKEVRADGSRVRCAKPSHLRPNPPKTHDHANPPLTLAVEVLQEGGKLPAPQRVGFGPAAAAFLGRHGVRVCRARGRAAGSATETGKEGVSSESSVVGV